ncbi:MAG TPA: roadblock/LC7 domain-containing protein [Geobacteraceae bacterium]|jgi:predicted regulator of Ras-like GTPase activity (Roadblock/LC7/MglB family)|nr:roadblock/LC7 domain-containing protein [Geobacteraceae bacterium]
MSFRGILRGLVENVEGGQGAVIMGYDGIPIDEYIREDLPLDIQLLSVEYATLLKEIRRTVEVLKTGAMDEISVNTGLTRVVVRPVNDDFFVVFVMDRDGNFGKGRYLLKRDAPKLAEALR